MGIVMSFQDSDLRVQNNDYTLALCICTAVGFVIGWPWLVATYWSVHNEAHRLAHFLGASCIFTLLFPIGAVVAGRPHLSPLLQCCVVYSDADHRGAREATESLAISTILLTGLRLSV